MFDLEKAKHKAHILEGLGIALLNVDEIISLIKKSKNTSEAKISLMSKSWKPGQLTKFLGIVDNQTKDFIPNLEWKLLNSDHPPTTGIRALRSASPTLISVPPQIFKNYFFKNPKIFEFWWISSV